MANIMLRIIYFNELIGVIDYEKQFIVKNNNYITCVYPFILYLWSYCGVQV